jgi:hypothetical protein
MKTSITAIAFTILLAATFGSAQSQKVSSKIPFEFTAAGKVLPAGQYEVKYDAERSLVIIKSSEKGPVVNMPILTMLAGAMHTTPNDSHIVFDKIGNKYFLSEIWIPGMDGIDLLSTKEKHEHEIVNVPVPR